MTYILGSKSLLAGVDPVMVNITKLAITLTEQDFGFTQPQLRTVRQEELLVQRGVSHSMHSHHLPQANGFGGAVDAVPWDGSSFVWEWPRIFVIARAFKAASTQMNVEITWGGVWDSLMSAYADPEVEERNYVQRRHSLGYHSVFVDGPHFELGKN